MRLSNKKVHEIIQNTEHCETRKCFGGIRETGISLNIKSSVFLHFR